MKKQEPVNCSDSELCTYLQALEEGFLPTFYSDISQFAPSKSINITSKFYQRGRKTVSFHGFQSLMMCKPSTEGHGADSSRLSLEDSHVRTSALQVKAQESTESAVGYGQRWPASLAKYDPDLRSWKTAQRSLIEDSDECSVIWPRSGMTVNGECWELPMLVRRTKETGCGLWLDMHSQHGSNVDAATNSGATSTTCMLSSATVHQLKNGTQTRIWPTPTATAYKGWSQNHNRADTNDRLDYTIEREAYSHGQQTPPMRLNPDWVEWLMGWPIGWTDLKPLEMDRCHYALQQHGAC